MRKLILAGMEISGRDCVVCVLQEEGEIWDLRVIPREKDSALQNIYVGQVETVSQNMEAAFVRISPEKRCFFPLKEEKNLIYACPKKESAPLKNGDLILVQVRKDAVKTKLPVADGNVRMAGKYFVLTLARKGLSLSKKIQDTEERKRLQSITKDYIKNKSPLEYGIVIRTNAAGVNREDLLSELQDLMGRCSRLLQKAQTAPGKTLIDKEPPYYIQIGRELRFSELDEILTDDPVILDELKDYYDGVIGEKICFYEDDYPLYLLYRFEHFYKTALYPINAETLEQFKKGRGSFAITHKSYSTKDKGEVEEKRERRIYSSDEIDPQYFDRKKESDDKDY